MNGRHWPSTLILLPALILLLAGSLLVACAQVDVPVPTLAPTLQSPSTPLPAQPTLPPPRIIAVPAVTEGGAAVQLPTGGASPQVIIHSDRPGGPIPPEVQRLLDDLGQGKILLNASPAGPDGQSVRYAYRDVNGDGVRDLVVIVVARPGETAGQSLSPAGQDGTQAIGINLDALVQNLNQNPGAPLINSAFVYTVSPADLDELGQ